MEGLADKLSSPPHRPSKPCDVPLQVLHYGHVTTRNWKAITVAHCHTYIVQNLKYIYIT